MANVVFSAGVQQWIDDLGQIMRVFYELATTVSEGASDRLSVGLGGGDIPFFPPFFALACVALALVLQLILGRWRWMPWPLNALVVRVAVFAAVVALFISTKAKVQEELLKQGTYLHFTAVKGLVTSGPFEITRNPSYLTFCLCTPALAVLFDSLLLLLVSPLLPYYLNQFVIPAEEKLLMANFPAEYESYAAKVPRWL
ncbi:hypothetical protein T492DRAFT_1096939 [Pavlovales sp. CCMP2436]|nr:hypothetical protein T492DRAFT_1096939 [Pavlovales sp. CCMP2436]|mmetsp:Transcript_2335/g.5728  ORF Transcript_2335/g.5728 Transcript_2335/m.5728 type:complete len:199 (-) Transcript_2335:147-743(-)|eukprot:CAMPEP_0179848440 /NCGR_PEP_ID=MMETSP0982-20121206/6623_1 /TAXON_ID=483367 /ORGANISM="non described non described, Strain CCMP 2436" /LENGTH=198 /DNA_ID=CAMNT_0021733703 /DNA_START=172 /DNA_END=768 /DNA_ORIENTATION=-